MTRNVITFFFKYRKWIYTILALPVLAGFIYQLIYYYVYPLPYISWSRFQLILFPIVEVLFLLVCFDIFIHRSNENNKSTLAWQLAFLISGINLLALSFLGAYYESRAQSPSSQLFISLVPVLKGFLIFCMVLCFFIGFGKSLVNTWKSFSFAEEASQKRTWPAAVILLTGFVVGLGLRSYNLGGFPPYIDEYIHTHDAIDILNGLPLEWGRAYLTVSLPVYVSYLIFGISLWASRLPMVVINMLAIFPLYALGRKINKTVGTICVALFVFSPWIIAASRTVRDYAVVPLFFYLAAFLLVDLLDWENLSFTQYLNKHKFRLAGAVLILGYSIYDNTSITKIILAEYAAIGLIVGLKTLGGNSLRWVKITILGLGGVLILFIIAQSKIIQHIMIGGAVVPDLTLTYWNALINGNVQQWYIWNGLGFLILLIGCFFAIRACFKRYTKNDYIVLFCFLVFAIILVYLTVFLVNPHIPARTRYGVLMEYWFLVVAAIALYVVFLGVRRIIRSSFSLIPVVLITGLFFNYHGIQMALFYQGGGTLQITSENHYIVEPAYQYLVGRMSDQDALISDVLQRYDEISGQQFRKLDDLVTYHWVFRGDTDPVTIIEQNPHGWIAVTQNDLPASFNLPFADFDLGDKHFQYIGIMGEIYIWHWVQKTP